MSLELNARRLKLIDQILHLPDAAVTEAEASRTIALPFFNQIEVSAIDEVCHTLGRLLQGESC